MAENNPESKAVAVVTKSELAKVGNSILNVEQLNHLLKKTPQVHRYTRPAKGGGTWDYVTGVYVKKTLNLMFGWNWSFEVKEHKFDLIIGQAFVLGRLTVTSNGTTIHKEQFGRVDIKFKKQTQDQISRGESRMPLDIGNDLKAATTDALKKCAAELGIAADVYAPNEFKEVRVTEDPTTEDKLEIIVNLYAEEGLIITEDERINIERIIKDKEEVSYDKAIKLLKSKLPRR